MPSFFAPTHTSERLKHPTRVVVVGPKALPTRPLFAAALLAGALVSGNLLLSHFNVVVSSDQGFQQGFQIDVATSTYVEPSTVKAQEDEEVLQSKAPLQQDYVVEAHIPGHATAALWVQAKADVTLQQAQLISFIDHYQHQAESSHRPLDLQVVVQDKAEKNVAVHYIQDTLQLRRDKGGAGYWNEARNIHQEVMQSAYGEIIFLSNHVRISSSHIRTLAHHQPTPLLWKTGMVEQEIALDKNQTEHRLHTQRQHKLNIASRSAGADYNANAKGNPLASTYK